MYFSYLYSRTDDMDRFHHEDPYYSARAANEWFPEGELEEVHEEDSEEEPEEYQELDYEEENCNEESNNEEGAREIVNEPYHIRSRNEPLPSPSSRMRTRNGQPSCMQGLEKMANDPPTTCTYYTMLRAPTPS